MSQTRDDDRKLATLGAFVNDILNHYQAIEALIGAILENAELSPEQLEVIDVYKKTITYTQDSLHLHFEKAMHSYDMEMEESMVLASRFLEYLATNGIQVGIHLRPYNENTENGRKTHD